MADFVSDIKAVPYNEDRVYAMLSDLSNLEKVKDRIPQDKIKDFEFDKDSCSVSVDKFTTVNSPVPLLMWIQLKQVAEGDTRMKLTVRADLNPLLKPMLSKPLQDGIDKIANALASLSY